MGISAIIPQRLWRRFGQIKHAAIDDWRGRASDQREREGRRPASSARRRRRGARYGSLGLALLLISSLIVIAFYTNHPTPETYPDTAQYLATAQHIMTSGRLVDPIRLPGYPLLIALAFLIAGQGNLAAVSIMQGILFALAVLEIYVIACLVTRRAWIGLIVGLAVASNTYLLTFIKPILSEGVSLWIVTSLTLAILLLIRAWRIRYMWLAAVFLLLAFMTRPEWTYGPVLLFGFLLLVAARHGRFRRVVPHALAAVLVLYGALGLYIYENATHNGYAGISVIQRINLLGKVMQYDMQNEAPPQYAQLTQEINAYRSTGAHSPYAFAELHPEVAANNWALADAYATTIVEHHPIEYALKTGALFFSSLGNYYYESRVTSQGPFWQPLFLLENLSQKALFLYQLFPFFALLWLGLLLWRRTARSPLVEMMGALSLIGLYELVLTSSGGYEAYARLHSAFNPVLLVVVWGTLLLGLAFLAQRMVRLPITDSLARLWPRICWVWGGLIAGGILLSAIITILHHGFAALLRLHSWSGYALARSFALNNLILVCAVLALLALFTRWVYQAHCLQVSRAAAGKSESDAGPEAPAQANDQANLLPGTASLARQPDS